jgi:hypothetical protein
LWIRIRSSILGQCRIADPDPDSGFDDWKLLNFTFEKINKIFGSLGLLEKCQKKLASLKKREHPTLQINTFLHFILAQFFPHWILISIGVCGSGSSQPKSMRIRITKLEKAEEKSGFLFTLS